jgi:uncharacterized membrane protein SpoIIM required for sporulation
MRLDPFLSLRSEGWRRLSALLDRLVSAGPGRLSVEELEELGRLYRRAASDLAYARAHFNDPETVSYLNQVVARGHAAIYRPGRARWGRVWRFLLAEFPRQVRSCAPFVAVAAIALFGSAAVGGVVSALSPESASLLVPEEFSRALREPGAGGTLGAMPAEMEALLGSVILTNNIQVGFLSFALGITCGVGTIYVLVQNGLMLGVLGGVLGRGKQGLLFWSLVAPHGGMELVAICICGGSGLVLGWALVNPGDLARREALIGAGRRAVPLVMGAAPMFGVAALVEAFVTPAPAPAALKLAIGGVGAVAALAYLGLAGREMQERERW